MVARLHVCDTLANRLHNTCALVPQNDWESTFRVFSRECIGIWHMFSIRNPVLLNSPHTGMANTSVIYLDANFVGFRRCYFDIFDGKVLGGLPGDGGLYSVRHW